MRPAGTGGGGGKGRAFPRGLCRALQGSTVQHWGCYNPVAATGQACRRAGPERDMVPTVHFPSPTVAYIHHRGNATGQAISISCVPGFNDSPRFYLR
jgi:hypothetical protein